MASFFCYHCKSTSDDSTKCMNVECLGPNDPTPAQVEHPNCGTDECCGECLGPEDDVPVREDCSLSDGYCCLHDGYDNSEDEAEAEHDGSVQIKIMAENVGGKLVIHDASNMESTWLETDMVYEMPDAYLLTLTLDGDKILAALPETKAISVDMR